MSADKQTLNFNNEEYHTKDRKAARAELRALRDAFPLKTSDSITKIQKKKDQSIKLKPVRAFCTAEEINLKYLLKYLKKKKMFIKNVAYYGECLFAQVQFSNEQSLRTSQVPEDVFHQQSEKKQDNITDRGRDGQGISERHQDDITDGQYDVGESGQYDITERGQDDVGESGQYDVTDGQDDITERDQDDVTERDQYDVTDGQSISEIHQDNKGNHDDIPEQNQDDITEVKDENTTFDVFFFEYGVTVFWGASNTLETKILRLIKVAEVNPYRSDQIEMESFSYGISKDALFCDDIIYLNSEYFFFKMVISCAIAQSVKLDYFEELTDVSIEEIKNLPEEVSNMGKTNYTRTDILKFIGRLHKLRINLNLVTNILDEPELLWNFPKYSELYESFKHCLEIKTRADILNQRCDVIHGILEILSENINTRNSERLEKMVIGLIGVSVVVGIVQIIVLLIKR
ncbi:Sporulation protein RMD1 [Pseudoloma neurophilia]|uniref:Sporulation protein RMD1 n=1 Tax=Pseudoloma neurophilia TaxID=146866 RepID=A0A0R0M198_9MICR|nr:Sporulation protein RMD1 [Pseudoloma neurophilia]